MQHILVGSQGIWFLAYFCWFTGFHMLDQVPQGHRFKNTDHQVTNPKAFFTAMKKEVSFFWSSDNELSSILIH